MNKEKIREVVEKSIRKDWGFGRLFNHIRKMKEFVLWSDLIIFRLILVELRKIGKELTKKQLLHHFRTKVSKNDYDKKDKSEIIADLTKLD